MLFIEVTRCITLTPELRRITGFIYKNNLWWEIIKFPDKWNPVPRRTVEISDKTSFNTTIKHVDHVDRNAFLDNISLWYTPPVINMYPELIEGFDPQEFEMLKRLIFTATMRDAFERECEMMAYSRFIDCVKQVSIQARLINKRYRIYQKKSVSITKMRMYRYRRQIQGRHRLFVKRKDRMLNLGRGDVFAASRKKVLLCR